MVPLVPATTLAPSHWSTNASVRATHRLFVFPQARFECMRASAVRDSHEYCVAENTSSHQVGTARAQTLAKRRRKDALSLPSAALDGPGLVAGLGAVVLAGLGLAQFLPPLRCG